MKSAQLYKNAKEIDQAVADFKGLQTNSGWLQIVRILDLNIAEVTEQILNKPEGASEADMDRLRDNLSIMKDIRNTPEDMIKKLGAVEEEESEMVDVDNIYDEAQKKD